MHWLNKSNINLVIFRQMSLSLSIIAKGNYRGVNAPIHLNLDPISPTQFSLRNSIAKEQDYFSVKLR